MSEQAVPNAGLWQEIIRFQRGAIRPSIGARNAMGVLVALAAGALSGHLPSGLVAATGALNVAFSDSDVPYALRARRMLGASIVVAVGVVAGALCAWHKPLIVAAAAAWAFAAGMLVALDQTAADLGTVSLVTLVVFAALPMSPENAFISGALALAGGLTQTLISVLLWPFRRYAAQRQVLAELFQGLADLALRPGTALEPPAASSLSTQAQGSLSALDRDYSVDAERYRALLSQAERIRLSLLALGRIRFRLERAGGSADSAGLLLRLLEISAGALRILALELRSPSSPREASLLDEAHSVAAALHSRAAEIGTEGIRLIDALAGQFRAAADLVQSATPESHSRPSRQEARRPPRLRLQSAAATLRANLSLQSAAFRHAVRLSATVAIAETLGQWLGLGRAYWAPMTVAIVLKPDFTATFSRGVLRLAGTLLGLSLATALFHGSPLSPSFEIALIALLTFAARGFGPANYGIAATAITALVVLLVALNGTAPGPVIHLRGLNTLIGGAVSLAAYLAWPTWERTRIAEMFAQLLDSYRAYFHAVRRAYEEPRKRHAWDLEQRRLAGRRARSNLEASMLRLASEPGTQPDALRFWSGMLANSHRLANALMALEAGLSTDAFGPPRPGFARFASDVEVVFHSLSAALRGSPFDAADLPDLRADHSRLVATGDPTRYLLVNIETDRIVNSLNTLSEEVLRRAA